MKQINNIFIGENIISKDIIKQYFSGNKFHIITDSTVKNLYLQKIVDELKPFDVTITVISTGESQKNLDIITSIYSSLTHINFSRCDTIIALGGGVVGDIAGFVASTYLRGVNFLQIPTTLLSQVDSAFGGKCAINFLGVKNVIGSFYDAHLTLVDTTFLKTLSATDFNDGIAEIIKYGLTLDKNILNMLDNTSDMTAIISRCIELKLSLTEKDPYDKNIRQILNFGHTIGHALESIDNFNTLTHGKAVAIGMVTESMLAFKLGLCPQDYSAEIIKILNKFSLPTSFSLTGIYDKIKLDKKRDNALINFTCLENIGSSTLKKIPLTSFEHLEEIL